MQKRGRRVTGCRCEAQPHAPSAPDAASLWYVRLRVPAGQACESRARERTLTAGSLSPLPALMDPEPPCERMQHHDAPDAWSASRASGGMPMPITCQRCSRPASRCGMRRPVAAGGAPIIRPGRHAGRGAASSEQRPRRAMGQVDSSEGRTLKYLDCRRRCRCPAPCWCMPSGGAHRARSS